MLPVIKRKLARFMVLRSQEKFVFVSAAVLMPLMCLALARMGLARSIAWMEAPTRAARARPAVSEMRALGQLVNLAAAHSPGASSCLARSMYLKWLLLRRGVECQLQIGVRMTAGVLEAHAWIEYQGEPINDRRENCQSFSSFNKPISLAPTVRDFV